MFNFTLLNQADPIIYNDEEIQQMVNMGKYLRAGGQCVCPVCKKTYLQHKNLKLHPDLTQICTGELFKL